jgi:hypothetical protein
MLAQLVQAASWSSPPVRPRPATVAHCYSALVLRPLGEVAWSELASAVARLGLEACCISEAAKAPQLLEEQCCCPQAPVPRLVVHLQ